MNFRFPTGKEWCWLASAAVTVAAGIACGLTSKGLTGPDASRGAHYITEALTFVALFALVCFVFFDMMVTTAKLQARFPGEQINQSALYRRAVADAGVLVVVVALGWFCAHGPASDGWLILIATAALIIQALLRSYDIMHPMRALQVPHTNEEVEAPSVRVN